MAVEEAKSLEKQGRLSNDKQKHCFGSCYYNRCKLLTSPGETVTGGILWEVTGWVSDDSPKDILADIYGTISSYNLMSTCETICSECNIR
jgi:hypothetical protein